ncbi:MAG: hypothetical protein KAJ29_07990 [Alphaproteobacteria bacterium]|nr:hypothetical protein [Alphaproteobacteria bacterium]
MTVHFYIWLFISLFLLGFWGWTLLIVTQQKRAWKVFAEKRKMRYHNTGMFSTPMVSGAIDSYGVSLFASEHSELDARSQRRLTVIEVSLQSDFPFSCAVASGGMVSVVDAFDIRHEYKPQIKGWDNSYVLRTSDLQMVQNYFTDERMQKILDLMKIEKAWIILIVFEDRGILRLDTPYPIDNPSELDKLIKQMIDAARAMEMKKGESKDLIRKQSEKVSGQPVLDVDEDLFEDHLGLELEE